MALLIHKAFGIGMLAILGMASCSRGAPMNLRGQAVLDSGAPIKEGTIVVTELKGRFFAVPSVTSVVTSQTDSEGKFSVTIDYRGGDLDISLEPSKCNWWGAMVRLKADGDVYAGASSIKLTSKAVKPGACTSN